MNQISGGIDSPGKETMLMKRRPVLIVITVLALSLLCVFAGAEEETLFPARGENGLWGYINIRGEWVINAKFTDCVRFEHSLTVASAVNDHGVEAQGIIDRNGNWVLEPYYSIDHADYMGELPDDDLWLIYEYGISSDGSYDWIRNGLFDENSGFISELRDDCSICSRYSGSPLVPVHSRPDENNEGLLGYINRKTGELTIPFMYDDHNDPSLFYEGVTDVCCPENLDHDDNETAFFLIDEQGNRIQVEDGLLVLYSEPMSCGRIRVQDIAADLYGYADKDGKLVIPAIYSGASQFRADRAQVWISETEMGLIDLVGSLSVAGDHFMFTGDISCGYAPIQFADKTKGWITPDGRIIENRSEAYQLYPVGKNMFWAAADQQQTCWHLEDEDGHILSDDYSCISAYDDLFDTMHGFCEGLTAVRNKNGLWGYLNEEGKEVIPCQWDDAWEFVHGLAYVVKDEKMAYIDCQGKIIWQEQ